MTDYACPICEQLYQNCPYPVCAEQEVAEQVKREQEAQQDLFEVEHENDNR